MKEVPMSTTTKERRKFLRIATSLEAVYWAKGPSMATGQAQVKNFSREGVGVLLPQSVEQGEYLDLTFKVPGDQIPILATGQVAWASASKDQTGVGAGLKFRSIKPLDLARLLDFVYARWLGALRESL
jgi:c-di-GMP-binding flagellar brake protein YcgR